MPPSLAELAVDPAPLTRSFTNNGVSFVFRALTAGDADALTRFLADLSDTSRRFWHDTDGDAAAAREWIDAIGRYDKLRFVVHRPSRPRAERQNEGERSEPLAAVVDLSFSLPEGFEVTRYARAGVTLDPDRTVRFGPCVADAWHGSGLAAAILPPTWDAVRLLGRDRVVLFGGVHADNHRARRYYHKHGFEEVADDGATVDMVLDLTNR